MIYTLLLNEGFECINERYTRDGFNIHAYDRSTEPEKNRMPDDYDKDFYSRSLLHVKHPSFREGKFFFADVEIDNRFLTEGMMSMVLRSLPDLLKEAITHKMCMCIRVLF